MDARELSGRPEILRFRDWRRESQQVGVRLTQRRFDPATFVPRSAITHHLTEERIGDLLGVVCTTHGSLNPGLVHRYYSAILCILLSIECSTIIASFAQSRHLRDERLPFTLSQLLESFPSHQYPNFAEAFYKAQWEWCPRAFEELEMFGQISEFEDHAILPIVEYGLPVGEGRSAQVHRIKLHKDYNSLSRRRTYYALKLFRPEHIHDLEKESTTYANIYKRAVDPEHLENVICYYGSFRQGDAHCLLLEYADRGNLESFFQETRRPSSPEEDRSFWLGLLSLASALRLVHEPECGKYGFHQDVKPSNILVVKKTEESNDAFNCVFKLSDFGHVHSKRSPSLLSPQFDQDTRGTRIHGAPECYQKRNDMRWRTYVTPAVDIWSFGTILSDAAVWAVKDYSGLETYRDERMMATRLLPDFEHEGAFHDGKDVLPQVTQKHENIMSSCRRDDDITGEVLNIVNRHMLVVAEQRLSAVELMRRVRQLRWPAPLRQISVLHPGGQDSRMLPPELPSDKDDRYLAKPRHNRSKSQINREPILTLDQAMLYLDKWESISRLRRSSAFGSLADHIKKGSSISIADVFEKGSSNFARLDGREQVFLIDNSSALYDHRKDMRKLFHVLGKMVKKSDKDGLDVYLTGSNKCLESVKSVSKHLDFLRPEPYRDRPDIVSPLRNILHKKVYSKMNPRYLTCQGNPLSVYVFTDGDWDWPNVTDDAPIDSTLTKVIEDLVNYLEPFKKNKTIKDHHVGIQFIRFGNSKLGKQRLDYLDDSLPVGADIIDTEDFGGCIWKMLVGAIDPNWDSRSTQTSDQASPSSSHQQENHLPAPVSSSPSSPKNKEIAVG